MTDLNVSRVVADAKRSGLLPKLIREAVSEYGSEISQQDSEIGAFVSSRLPIHKPLRQIVTMESRERAYLTPAPPYSLRELMNQDPRQDTLQVERINEGRMLLGVCGREECSRTSLLRDLWVTYNPFTLFAYGCGHRPKNEHPITYGMVE